MARVLEFILEGHTILEAQDALTGETRKVAVVEISTLILHKGDIDPGKLEKAVLAALESIDTDC